MIYRSSGLASMSALVSLIVLVLTCVSIKIYSFVSLIPFCHRVTIRCIRFSINYCSSYYAWFCFFSL